MVQTARFTGVARKIIDTPGYKCYRYHDTDVVRVANCRSHAILDSGGHRTYSTKLAMNQAFSESGIPARVLQDDGEWFVIYGGLWHRFKDGFALNLR